MKLPKEPELVLLIKKRASVLIFLNICINLVLKIQQPQNKYHLALYNFITGGGGGARKGCQGNQGGKAQGERPQESY